ncbi:MAG: response regulator transcription factor [Thiothrix sp.]|nr:MAG: response regulator transcription factor [Thiothrix sp.]
MTTSHIQRVFLVEDDQGTLNRLAEIIRTQTSLNLVGMAGTYTEAAKWLEANSLDVLLTDLGLPDGNGKQLIEQTREQHPKAEIMVISRFGDENSVVEAIKAGASGYLLKDESATHIAEGIQQLLQGGSPISPAIARYILDYFQQGDSGSTSGSENDALLTPKEKMVLQYISRGYSNKEIARSLDISPHTVASHIKRIYQKLEVNSRNEAVFEGWRMGQLSMLQNQASQPAHKDAKQVAEALKMGGKSGADILDVLKMVFGLDMGQCIQCLQQLHYSAGEIFMAVRKSFNADDKSIIQAMLSQGFSHEEALKAMLDQL